MMCRLKRREEVFMNLTLHMNYDTVNLDGRTVRINEKYNNATAVNRFVETVSHRHDDTAVNYILDIDFKDSDNYVTGFYNALVEKLQRKARIYNNFGIETQLLGRNIGAGFCAAVKEEDFAETVETVEKLMHILGLDKDYQLISRYENLGVYAIIRK